jgi:L-threonylcarbamoyladenylate synthase
VARLIAVRGRETGKPILVLVDDLEMAGAVSQQLSPAAARLAERFWPGPLTLVLPAKKGVPAPLVNREGKVGVRVSSHPVAAQLAGDLGRPLTATSANPSGEEPARTIAEARAYFAGKLNIFLDGGALAGRIGSTVAEVIDDRFKVIREGEIAAKELERYL